VIIVLERGVDTWTPHAIIRLDLSAGQIVRIVDYTHCPWVLTAATSLRIENRSAPARIPGLSAAVLPANGSPRMIDLPVDCKAAVVPEEARNEKGNGAVHG
jgi:hypothetical protein